MTWPGYPFLYPPRPETPKIVHLPCDHSPCWCGLPPFSSYGFAPWTQEGHDAFMSRHELRPRPGSVVQYGGQLFAIADTP